MSTRAYCVNPEPHGYHDWSQLAGGYVVEHELIPSYNYHWCSGVKDNPELRRLMAVRDEARSVLAAAEEALVTEAKLWHFHDEGLYCNGCNEALLSDGVVKVRDGAEVIEMTRCCEVELDRYPFTDL